MIHKYRKFGMGFIFMGALSFVSAYAGPLCCSQVSHSTHSFPAIPAHATVLNKLPKFNAISCDGPIDVQIYGEANCQEVIFTNPQAIRAEVKGNTLYLSEGIKALGKDRLRVRVYMDRDLNQLSLARSASVAGEYIQSRCLAIFDESCSDLCLRGHIGLNQLMSSGSGNIDIEWVDSDSIEIAANTGGHIHLAGRANRLYAKLGGTVVLDTHYLRVKSAWVKNNDASLARLSPSESLNVFSDDAADLEYYRSPKSSYMNTKDFSAGFNMADMDYDRPVTAFGWDQQ